MIAKRGYRFPAMRGGLDLPKRISGRGRGVQVAKPSCVQCPQLGGEPGAMRDSVLGHDGPDILMGAIPILQRTA